MYFECNIPECCQYKAVIQKRMEKLEKALGISQFGGEAFAKAAKIAFDNRSTFDELSAEELAEFAVITMPSIISGGYNSRIVWPNATVVVDTDFVRDYELEDILRNGVSENDVDAVVGKSPYNTAADIYQQKVKGEKTPSEKTAIAQRGHIQNDRIMEAFSYVAYGEVKKETRLFASKKHPECMALVKGVLQMPGDRLAIVVPKGEYSDFAETWQAGKIPEWCHASMTQASAVLDDPRVFGTFAAVVFIDDIIVRGRYTSVPSAANQSGMKVVWTPRDKRSEDLILQTEDEWVKEYLIKKAEPKEGKLYEREGNVETPDNDIPYMNAEEFLPVVLAYTEKRNEYEAARKKAEMYDEASKMASLPFMVELAESHMEKGQLAIGDEKVVEIKYAGNSKKGDVNWNQVVNILDACPDIPTEVINALKDCKQPDGAASPVFSIGTTKSSKWRM